MEYQSFYLPNGIRCIHQFDNSSVAYCGIILNTGSRDEEDTEQGLAHFIEHIVFKGTAKRRAYQILNYLENVGGEINAYTTKEETCIYSIVLTEFYERAFDLMSDLLFNSIFPEKEIEKEKQIIIDEIYSYLDSPAELIFDDFEELIYSNQALGRNILGTPESVAQITVNDIKQFIQTNYNTDQMVVCSVGNVTFDKFKRLAEKYFSKVVENKRIKIRQPYTTYIPQSKRVVKETYQTHCVLGNVAYSYEDNRRVGLRLLNNILGGPGMNSRLNMALREKHGYSYNVESSYTPYTDTGELAIYFSGDKDKLDKSIALVNKEIKLLSTQKLGSMQLHRAKKQLIGQIAISSENKENLMMSLGRSFLIFDRIDTLEEVYQRIEVVTASELIEIANDVLDINKLSMLIYE